MKPEQFSDSRYGFETFWDTDEQLIGITKISKTEPSARVMTIFEWGEVCTEILINSPDHTSIYSQHQKAEPILIKAGYKGKQFENAYILLPVIFDTPFVYFVGGYVSPRETRLGIVLDIEPCMLDEKLQLVHLNTQNHIEIIDDIRNGFQIRTTNDRHIFTIVKKVRANLYIGTDPAKLYPCFPLGITDEIARVHEMLEVPRIKKSDVLELQKLERTIRKALCSREDMRSYVYPPDYALQ